MALLARYAVMFKQSGCARYDAQSKCHARCAPWVLLPHDNGPRIGFGDILYHNYNYNEEPPNPILTILSSTVPLVPLP